CRSRDKPASCDNRTDAWNGQKTEPGEKARSAANSGTDAGALACAFGAIIHAVAIAIDALRSAVGGCPAVGVCSAVAGVPVVGIVGDDADVAARDTGCFKILHRLRGAVVA